MTKAASPASWPSPATSPKSAWLRNAARRQHEAPARGLTCDVALDLQSVPLVRGTASELREGFVNIILNALDAMPQGERLRISAKHKNGFVRVAFSDNGVGMTRELRQR